MLRDALTMRLDGRTLALPRHCETKNTAHFDKRAVFLCVYLCGCANVIR